MEYTIKAMGLGEILDQAAKLFRNNLATLLGIACYMMIPLSVAQVLVMRLIMPAPLATGATQEEAQAYVAQAAGSGIMIAIVSLIYLVLYAFIVTPVTNAAVMRALASEYLGKKISAAECIKYAFHKFGAILGTSILIALIIVGLGFVLLLPGYFVGAIILIPGMIVYFILAVYFALKYYLAIDVVVIEDKSGQEALKRSGELMKGNFGSAFVLGLVVGIIAFVVKAGIAVVPIPLVHDIVNVVVQVMLVIYGIAASVVFYFSNRCKLENFDLTILAESVKDVSGPAPAAAAATPAGQ